MTAGNTENMRAKMNNSMGRIIAWVVEHGLNIVLEKSEVPILKDKGRPIEISFRMGQRGLGLSKTLKYINRCHIR